MADTTGGVDMVYSLALLVSRAIVGGTFAVHGYAKLFGGPGKPVSPRVERYLGSGFVQSMNAGGVSGVAETFRALGIPFPRLMARVVSIVEFGGGLLVMLGLLTRPAALLLAGDMSVAIRKVHWRHGLIGPSGFEIPLALLAGCLGLIGAGPGDLSLDNLLRRRFSPRRQKAPSLVSLAMVVTVTLGLGALLARLSRPERRTEAHGTASAENLTA